MKSLQFASKSVCSSSYLPDHRWLDGDQQYCFVQVDVLCNKSGFHLSVEK